MPVPTVDLPAFAASVRAIAATALTPKFWLAHSWQAALSGLGLGTIPDLLNAGLSLWLEVDAALPTMTLETKAYFFGATLLLVVLLRPWRQGNMPDTTRPVARFYLPDTVQLRTSSGAVVPVEAEAVVGLPRELDQAKEVQP